MPDLKPSTSQLSWSLSAVVIAAALALVWLLRDGGSGDAVSKEAPERESEVSPVRDSAPEEQPEPELLPLRVLADAPFATEFGQDGTTPERELQLVLLAFGDYLQFVKGRYRRPFGFNEELVALLVGGNPLRIAPIPPDHPRIDSGGRLADRWGTPFDIHPLSSTAIEVRSAGPDKKMWTGDDLRDTSLSGQDVLDRMTSTTDQKREETNDG